MSGIHMGLLATRSAGPAFLASSFARGTTNSLVIAKPAGLVSGNLLIAVMCTDGGGSRTWTGDTSWTEVYDENSVPNLRVAYLVAGSAEPANYTFTLSGAAIDSAGFVMAFERATYDSIGAVATSLGVNDIVAPSINFSLPGVVLGIYVKASASGTFTTPAGMSALLADSDVNSPSMAIFSQFSNIGATGTRTSTPIAGNTNAGILLGMV